MPDYKLDDVNVLDFSTFVTGGKASQRLAYDGANVKKIERPDVGDPIRHSGGEAFNGLEENGDFSPYHVIVNPGKESLELNLKKDGGMEIVYEMVEASDVLIQNWTPGTAEKLGLDYGTVAEGNEEFGFEGKDDIIYCDISGYGDSGPIKDHPAYDLIVQARSGLMDVTGEEDGGPVKIGVPITDLATASEAQAAILSSLYHREKTGEGEYIEISMLESALDMLTKQAGKALAGGETKRMGTKDPVLAPYQVYDTKDGEIAVAALDQRQWGALTSVLGAEELAEDDRFETNDDRVDHMDELEEEIEEVLAARETEELVQELVAAGVPAGPVLSVEEALHQGQIEARDALATMEIDDVEVEVPGPAANYENSDNGFMRPAPGLGDHTYDELKDKGFIDEEIEEMAIDGVFGTDIRDMLNNLGYSDEEILEMSRNGKFDHLK